MQVRVERWGNSLAVRIPKSLVENVKVKERMIVDLTIRQGKIMAIMVEKRKRSLKQLLDKVNNKNRHAEIDFAASIGRESW
jgi:antitoxin MazE